MKLAAFALPKALAAGLKPIYVILGEEPLAALEAADSVRAAARKAGFSERVPLFAEAGFRWTSLAAEGASQSLFAEKRLLDLKIPTGKPGNDGSRALIEYAAAPPPDTVLLVTALNTDWKTAKTAWVKAAAKAGVAVECRPPPADEMPGWIKARLRARKVTVPPEAIALIADCSEGNPLAAAQAIERLRLIAGEGTADMDQVRAAVVDEARFGLFELADAALAGNATKALRILARLRETGMAEVLLLWTLARELRLLEAMAWANAHGGPPPKVFPRARRGLVARAAKRHSVHGWQALIADAARLDRAIKGRASETSEVLAERLLMNIAGVGRDENRTRAA